MDAATTPGTGRLGRGARSAEPPTPTELRRFLASDFARRLATAVQAAGAAPGQVISPVAGMASR